MVLSIALGIVLAVGIIYGIFFLYGLYLWHKTQKKEEERIRRNAEIEEKERNGELKLEMTKPLSERLKEKYLERGMKSKKDSWDSIVKWYIIGFCVFCGIAIIIVITALILKY